MNFDENIKKIEKILGYTFKDKSLLRQAFTRTSYCNEHRNAGQSNEVLEFFGDSILSAAIVTLFMKEFSERCSVGIKTSFAEGEFTVIRSKLSDKKNLSDRIRDTGMQQFLRMGEGDAKLGVADEPSVMEDLFESIVGAMYIDCGMDMPRVIAAVSRLLDVKQFLSAKAGDKSSPVQSFKNRLQEFCADKHRRLPPPVYKTVSESGPEHKKVYERACYVGDRLCAVGKGKNQKAADADAAEKALAILEAEAKKAEAPVPDAQAVAKLKEYARANKLATPTFRDLGETENSTPSVREYAVMCSFAGIEETAKAQDKQSARASAAEKILSRLKKPPVQKNTAKAASASAKKRKATPRVTKSAPKIRQSTKQAVQKKQGAPTKSRRRIT